MTQAHLLRSSFLLVPFPMSCCWPASSTQRTSPPLHNLSRNSILANLRIIKDLEADLLSFSTSISSSTSISPPSRTFLLSPCNESSKQQCHNNRSYFLSLFRLFSAQNRSAHDSKSETILFLYTRLDRIIRLGKLCCVLNPLLRNLLLCIITRDTAGAAV